MTDLRFRAKLAAGQFFVVPGIHDMIAAVVADRVGFDVVYGSGYWLTASAYGLPDAGIASYTQMVDRMATLARTSKAAVIADADTGYGGLLNVHHTVKGYEAAGVSAIQIEDQEFPKKCGHTPFKRLIPLEDMAEKIKVAVAARSSGDLLIIARTDARQSEGLDGTLRRLEAYAKAGADVVFPEALQSEEEMRTACASFDLPVMANMANGGLSPVPNANVLAEIGYTFAIYPSLTSLVAAHAMERALIGLKEQGIGEPDDLFDFKTFCSMIGFDEVWAFEKKWGGKA
ncbi:isocitrate lyase/PEP mutase family protein [Sphingomonas sp. AR_OL41]|uniref:isocitrate lyase/PEP mutase family protein n=1 Tax=Sphingomonas sp. AR_OL41 TaxID=3042729 RepID=UPI0024813CEE|nr:isocitrate lyase/PEP mutase family protein [Sphingomonas sp. AR_OL41]MDH7973218.1 isocitrate lyase/PEP mutase family protein [Sphingomonas sp. AR_OL41]